MYEHKQGIDVSMVTLAERGQLREGSDLGKKSTPIEVTPDDFIATLK